MGSSIIGSKPWRSKTPRCLTLSSDPLNISDAVKGCKPKWKKKRCFCPPPPPSSRGFCLVFVWRSVRIRDTTPLRACQARLWAGFQENTPKKRPPGAVEVLPGVWRSDRRVKLWKTQWVRAVTICNDWFPWTGRSGERGRGRGGGLGSGCSVAARPRPESHTDPAGDVPSSLAGAGFLPHARNSAGPAFTRSVGGACSRTPHLGGPPRTLGVRAKGRTGRL